MLKILYFNVFIVNKLYNEAIRLYINIYEKQLAKRPDRMG